MDHRPAIGSLGRTLSPLSPDGQVEFDGVTFPARGQADAIDAGRYVLLTGFDPRFLIVREAMPGEVATAQTRLAGPVPDRKSHGLQTVLRSFVLALGILGGLSSGLVGASFHGPPLLGNLLLAGGLLGPIGGLLAYSRRRGLATAVLVFAGLAPVAVSYMHMIVTFPLLIAAALALLVRPN